MKLSQFFLASIFAATNAFAAPAFIVTDLETGKILAQEGDIEKRASPYCSFNIALSLMGYDAGYLIDEAHPTWKYQEEYKTWTWRSFDNWEKDQDPSSWIKNSCVWFSQLLTKTLGAKHFKSYVRVFDYGNMDISGHPDFADGLFRSWLGSSLKISPLEQVGFLRKMLKEELGLTPQSYERAKSIFFNDMLPNGWAVYGKTGSGYHQNPFYGWQEGSHQIGWFVGWANKDDQTLLFAQFIEDEKEESTVAGRRAKEQAKEKLLSLIESLP